MAFTISKEYLNLAIKARRNSAKISPKLTKSKPHDRHFCGITVVKFGQVSSCQVSALNAMCLI